ncbi:hypothetical protein [Anabaena sp. UHCC 0399]|uniref:hypothetical protein n=1 Tax=Anabaena sp. UHCC 0399 TaxID=3110238 RepID=UPI002B211D3E|nr:hypothetical protein [Anabaena sp. UHCC 0399]MEA5568440.1 hypothetical protein [Anabaena sp. UHCC 0399]
MPNRRYPPAYLRYLKARLMNLRRPSFWGTAIFLSVVGLVIQEYWANPNLFGERPDNAVSASDPLSASFSAEDRAIAADIDNLPLLFGTNEQLSLPVPTNNPPDDKSKNSLLDAASKQKSTDQQSKPTPNSFNTTATSQNQNLFVSQTQSLLRFGATDNNHLLGFKSLDSSAESRAANANSPGVETGLFNQTNQNQNNNSTNPLTTVVNSSTSQNSSSVNSETASPINSVGSSYYGRVIQTSPNIISPSQTFSPSGRINSPTNYIQPSGYNNFNNGQTFSPNTGLNSSTNYIQPNTPNLQPGVDNNLNNQPLTSSPGYVQPNTTNIQPGFYNNLNNGQVSPNQVQVTSPVITRTSPIIGPYTIRNPSPGVVTNTMPLVPNSYGNSIWQQPNQVPQPNVPYNPYTSQPQRK